MHNSNTKGNSSDQPPAHARSLNNPEDQEAMVYQMVLKRVDDDNDAFAKLAETNALAEFAKKEGSCAAAVGRVKKKLCWAPGCVSPKPSRMRLHKMARMMSDAALAHAHESGNTSTTTRKCVDEELPAKRHTRSRANAMPLRLSPRDQSAGKQPDGKSKSGKGKTVAEQRKKVHSTIQTTSTEQTPELAADAFTAALGAIPADDWCRTWAADRTIMLRMTSKRVKEAVDKLRPPAHVKASKTFIKDARNGTAAERLQHIIFRRLETMTPPVPHHET